ncbi:MAG: sigma-54 dependent transcriptional regulator [Candidatus Marinimicrobia bacterium]|nr:sigma-54 dependent transcriptional regulator [Candidatus Neomarinimicrobiota bacterium]MCF7830370.1 sigma-54 dependent transcriptional regulator [Candidatus Neomarinimicrobiota bacterium]MCF7882168.1 sigma-54 dependent transcriptional regulator [Candidatus Neomarinimicrobiota bacterium]
MLEAMLESDGYEVLLHNNTESCLAEIHNRDCDLVITDLKLPDGSGFDILREVKRFRPETMVIFITAFGTVENAVDAMKSGAYDFIPKPIGKDELLLTVHKALRFRELKMENRLLRNQLSEKYSFDRIVGKSVVMQKVFSLLSKVANSDSTVLLTGETGTGKELAARAIHYNSPRKEGPFIPVDCSAIPKDLVASELFGHKQGSFTGATGDQKGKFVLADGGTILLDEVGEIPQNVQVQLLRVLQQRKVTPIGHDNEIPVDVRIIAATNRDLEEAVESGAFREDLYFRLNVFPVHMPPLRDRREDIPLLVDHFLQKHAPDEDIKVTQEAFNQLFEYGYPGNVRELENIIERALILSEGGDIYPEHLPDSIGGQKNSKAGNLELQIPDTGISLEQIEKDLITKALDKAKGNQTRAAELLDISRQTLIYRMEKYNLRTDS